MFHVKQKHKIKLMFHVRQKHKIKSMFHVKQMKYNENANIKSNFLKIILF